MISRLLPRSTVGIARLSRSTVRGGGLVIRDGEREEREAQALFTRRGLLIGLAHAAAFGALGSRLYQLQVLEAAEIAAQALDNRTRIIPIAPQRGRILDAAGNVLAANREIFRILVIPERGGDLRELRPLLARLAPLVGLSKEDQERLFVKARGQARHIPLLVTDGVSFEQVAALQLRASDLPGVRAETVWARSYVARERDAQAMAHIVGYVGAVDKRALDDDPILRLADARVGKAGVEAGMEAELRGAGGQAQIEVDARSRFVRRVSETAPLAGRDVRVSVETALQAQVMERLARDGRPGACVVLECVTGDVRVMASTPTFDAGQLAGAQSKAAWQAVSANKDKPLLNRAIAGQYPPGSTFKMVTALAGLDAGLLTVKEKIECWGDVTYAGHMFRCWNRKGHIASDLHKALRESCDCYFYEVARRVGMEAIAAKARELGLGQTYDAGISQQKAGLIPTPGWKRNRSKTGWLIGETVLAGIGQGYVLATPLQLAVMTARIATGKAVTPTLVARLAGDPDPQFPPLAISGVALDAVRRAMVAVVNEPGGTGQAADIDDGVTVVAGKTGTSQVSRASADRDRTVVLDVKQRDHALMVAYFPAGKPRYAVAVVLEHAGGGGAMAGPLVRDVVAMLVERDHPVARTGSPLFGDGADAGKRADVR